MDIQQYFIYFIIITAFGILYSRWEKKYIDEDKDETTEHIRQFLLNRELTQNIDIFAKPFLWIHVDSELNSPFHSNRVLIMGTLNHKRPIVAGTMMYNI